MNNRYIKPGDDVDYELYNLNTTEHVCSKHIKDDFIINQIKSIGTKGICDYCGKTLNVIELHELLKLIIVGINYLYEDIYGYLSNESLYCRKDEYVSESDYLTDSWSYFKNTVKHKARFVFHFSDIFSGFNLMNPIAMLEKVQDNNQFGMTTLLVLR